MNKARLRLLRAILMAIGVVMVGTVGLSLIEEWTVWRSLFFTLITITTVGYGDYGLSTAGEKFTSVLMICGIGVATYTIGQVMHGVMEQERAWRQRMNKRIMKLEDHVIVCGLGRLGMMVCRKLAMADVPFVVIDRDEKSVERVIEAEQLAVRGEATDDATLEEAGIARARAIVCCARDDTENIVITLSARGMNPGIDIISRAEEETSIRKLERAGASRVISPTQSGGHQIAEAISHPHLAEFLAHTGIPGLDFELTELKIAEGAEACGRALRELGRDHGTVAFIAVRHSNGEGSIRPPMDEVLAAEDVLIVAGDTESLRRIRIAACGRQKLAA